jgi:hypothetical protein
MVFERNESKLSNLLQSFDNLPENDFEGLKRFFFDIVRELERTIEEQEKAFQKLKKQFEEHEELDYVSAHATPMTKKQHEQELLLQEAILDNQKYEE